MLKKKINGQANEPATKGDIEELAVMISRSFDRLVTKEDAKQFVTKEDAKQFATKEDLKKLVTKEDAKQFVTKEDAKQFATQESQDILQAEVERLALSHDRLVDLMQDIPRRVAKLEART